MSGRENAKSSGVTNCYGLQISRGLKGTNDKEEKSIDILQESSRVTCFCNLNFLNLCTCTEMKA